MKKITLLLAAILVGAHSFAQIVEDFENGIPDEWAAVINTGDCGWELRMDTPSSQADFSSIALMYDDDACGDGAPASNLTVTTADYDVSGGEASLTYEVWFQEFGDQTFTLEVWDGTEWVLIETFDENTGGPITVTNDLSAYTNIDFRLRWTYDDNNEWGWGAGIDNFELSGAVLSSDENDLVDFKVFPNPAQNVINLVAASPIESIAIYNVLGQEVLAQEVGANQKSLNIESLKPGAYFLKAVANGTLTTTKIIKK